jgi:hypothetical protein
LGTKKGFLAAKKYEINRKKLLHRTYLSCQYKPPSAQSTSISAGTAVSAAACCSPLTVGGAAVSSILSAVGSLPGELAAAAGGSCSSLGGGGATLGFALFRMLDAMFQKDSFSCERGKTGNKLS